MTGLVLGIAATAVFCFITAWNEYAFALILTNRRAQTAPPFIPSQVGTGLQDWTVIAAGTVLFLLPVAIFTFLLYGVLPCSIVLYLMGTPMRRRARLAAERQASGVQPDSGGEPAGDAVTAERKEV